MDVVLIFKQLDGALDASPSNLELTVVDATGNAVSVGGADTSVSLAQVGGWVLVWVLLWMDER